MWTPSLATPLIIRQLGPPALTLVPKPKLKSIVVCPAQGLNLDLNKVLSFLSKAPTFSTYHFLSALDIDPDTEIPMFFHDPLTMVHLACLMPPRSLRSLLKKLCRPWVWELSRLKRWERILWKSQSRPTSLQRRGGQGSCWSLRMCSSSGAASVLQKSWVVSRMKAAPRRLPRLSWSSSLLL